MENFIGFIVGIAILISAVFITRWLGAWMLRINDVLDNQCRIIEQNEINKELLAKIAVELEKLNAKSEQPTAEK